MIFDWIKKPAKNASLGLMFALLLAVSFTYSSGASAAGTNQSIVSEAGKVVTVTFDTYAAQAGTLAELKTRISVERNFSGSFTALGANDTIAFSGTDVAVGQPAVLTVTLETPLTGVNNRIKMNAGALLDNSGGPRGEFTTPYMSVVVPQITGKEQTSRSDSELKVYFNGSVTSLLSDEELRSKFLIAQDGVNYQPLPEDLRVQTWQWGENFFSIYGSGAPIAQGPHTRLKIKSGTLLVSGNNAVPEIDFDIGAPRIQNATISEDFREVTIAFDEEISVTDGYNLKSYIYKYRHGYYYSSGLSDADTVSINNDKIVISLAEPLSGSKVQFSIYPYAVRDRSGNFRSGDNLTTPLLTGNMADITPPEFMDSYLSDDSKTAYFVYNEEILPNREDMAGSIQTGNDDPLPAGVSVTVSGNTLAIYNPQGWETDSSFQFPNNIVKDVNGNVAQNDGYWSISGLYPFYFSADEEGWFAADSKSLFIWFNEEIADNTFVTGTSHLKEKLSISTDGGMTYRALSEQDRVSVDGNNLFVEFKEPPVDGGYVFIKIEAGAVTAKYPFAKPNDLIEVKARYSLPEVTGFFRVAKPSEFVFADNPIWRSKVKQVYLYSHAGARALSSSEYTLTAGKLTANAGVFLEGDWYKLAIDADGYARKLVEGRGVAGAIYYMTEPVMTTANGLTATIDVFDRYGSNYSNSTGTQAIVFELMNGTTPVSIVSADLKVATGMYTVNFNVADAATNPNYTVRAFIVGRYDNDPSSVSTNMATIISQSEMNLYKLYSEID